MAWTNLTFPFASLLTSLKMTQLDDNFDALAAGLTGAPPILEAAYGAGSIDRTALKTTTASITGTIPASGRLGIVLSAFPFFPMIHDSGSVAEVNLSGHASDGANPDSPRFSFDNNTAVSKSIDVDYRFINM